MPAAAETKAAADIRREVEERSRILAAKQNQLLALMKGTQNGDGERRIEPHQADQIRSLESECVQLTGAVNALKLDYIQAKTEEDLERSARQSMGDVQLWPGTNGDGDSSREETTATKGIHRLPSSLGEAFVESEGYKKFVHGSRGQMAHVDVPALNFHGYAAKAAMKATLTTSGFTSYERPPGAIELGQQQLTIADLLGQAQTDAPTIRYLQETSFTNAATTVAEEGQKPEATWVLAEVDSPVRKIAWMTRLTQETFEDYPAVRDYVNDRLPFGVRQREEFQLISGDGTGTNLTGILPTTGVQVQAKGTNSNVDAIYLAITKVRTVGFYEPDGVVIHPNNWSVIRLLKSTTGEYLYGDPALGGPETIFGKRVIVTVNITANTALTGNFKQGATVYYRNGIRVEATNSDACDFQYNRIAIRAEERLALAVWRPPAFCKITGLDAA